MNNKQHQHQQFRTRAIHVGQAADPQTGAVVQPVHMASTFVQHKAGEWREFDYSRTANPTRSNAEQTIASLEGGIGSLAFSTGMAATHCVTMLLEAGDHIVAGSDIYGGTYRLLHKIVNKSGITTTLASNTNLDELEAAFTPDTKLLWAETIGNPLMSITDIAACAELAHKHGAFFAIDSTFAPPCLTRPLELGADIVMHSATKSFGGHSDLMGGVLTVRDPELLQRLHAIQNATGAIMSPWCSFLLSRGLKTLDLRVREQSRTAQHLAEWLAAHPSIKRVLYPGLPNHPGHEIAAGQMDGGFGTMISFELDGSFEQTKLLVESTKLFQLAVSLGAVESLIEQPASMSHASYDKADREAFGITDGLVRISVGLEGADDLQSDLEAAIAMALEG